MFNYLKGFFITNKGRKFGNEIADYLGVERRLFHCAMEEGGCDMHLVKLYNLKLDGFSLEDIAVDAWDFLIPGLDEIEKRFGGQNLIQQARKSINQFQIDRANSDLSNSGYQENEDELVRGDGRFELRYQVMLKQCLRGEDFLAPILHKMRSDDLEGLKGMALMHKLAGEDVELWDLELGVEIIDN
ncbi:hypothetical protein [Kangiella sp.]|uniref:hypothetical protein n=1 Tax=Kangiella sp. TaxID=1920245 RepID=UPI003A92813D